MHYVATVQELQMLKARTKHLYCRLELLDKDLNVLDSLEGLALDGSISIDANADVRHTFSSTIYLKKNETISKYSTEDWVDKLVHVYIGVKAPGSSTYWYSKGVYAFNTNGFTYNATEHNLSISCVDLVALLDGTLSGTLTGTKTTLQIGLKIKQAIIDTFKLAISYGFIGHVSYMVDYWNRTIPYDIDFGTASSVWSILTQLRDLYYPFEMYFNDTTFVCQEIPSGFDDPIVMDNEDFQEFVISEGNNIDYGEIKNCIELFGASIEYDTYVENMTHNVSTDIAEKNSNTVKSSSVILNVTNLDMTNDCNIALTTPFEGFCKNVSIKINNTVTKVDGEKTTKNVYQYGPFTLYKSDVDENGTDVPIDGTSLAADTMIVIKYSKDMNALYYRGEQQTHAMALLVDKEPTEEELKKYKRDEACNNIKFISLGKSSGSITEMNPRFTIDKIGRRNKVCSGQEYEVYYTDESAMQCAEYELWKSCRLTDSVNVECLLIPWLDVNQKITYVPEYIDTHGEALEFIIKKIDISIGEGTMTLTLMRYFPYYPYIVQNKY